MLRFLILCFISFFIVFPTDPCHSDENLTPTDKSLDDVTLQLKWKHQFQFAGYYAALEKGFYRQAGLNVKIIEAKAGEDITNKVIRGEADFGIAMSDLIQSRAQGHPVVALATIYQHSPLIILAAKNSGIENIHDFKGKKIALEPHSAQLLAYFESEGLPAHKLIIYPHDYSISKLISGEVDAISAYSTDEPFMLLEKGIEYSIFSPRAAGIDFYGDTLFTSERQISEHPERVSAFLEASLKGWEYALDNSEEVIDLILSKYTKRHSRQHLLFEAAMSKKLIMSNVVELGYMNPGRWLHTVNIFKKLKQIPETFSLNGFIYDRNPKRDLRWLYLSLFSAIVIGGLFFLISARFYKLNKLLKLESEERKKAEEAVVKSETFLNATGQIAKVGGWEIDGETKKVFWTKEIYNITEVSDDYDPSSLEKEAIVFFSTEDQLRLEKAIQRAFEQREPYNMELQLTTAKGNKKWVHAICKPIVVDGKVVNLGGIFQDITDSKQAEKQKAELESQLQQARKMEAIATLAGGVAHEFNNALMGIMGNIELLKMNFFEDGGIDKHLESMKSAGHRMSRLTDQLLAYAEGGKYQPKDLKLDDFVIQTLPILKHDLSPAVRVETHFPKDISYIKADHAQMQMVLSAILTNSNEAIEDEGLIKITGKNKDLDEDFTKQHPGLKPGSYVCFMIEDDGEGMDKETKDGIFEPFFTTKFQGRGMGMAAVHGIVENHDGWISVDSEVGRGTKVQIYLPAIEIEIEKPKKTTAEVATGSGTILMIEDEDVVVEVTQAMLEMLGYRVMVAKTGKDAIHIAETFDGQIDLALLDIKLPDIDGRKLYPLIMKARSNLKVIVFSGYSIDGPAREILDAGAQDFIQKPFSLAALSEKLKGVLEGK